MNHKAKEKEKEVKITERLEENNEVEKFLNLFL
jgi:hypothetical protein